MPKKLKEEIQENQKTVKKGLQRQMIMDGGEVNKLKFCCVVQNIEPQKKLREYDEIRKNVENSSPMSKTRSKQGSEEWRNSSYVSKNIVKQIIEGSLGYCARGPMGVSSPMSKTRPKQGQDCSNASKTIDKQGVEVRSGFCANGPMGFSSTISKTRSKLFSEGKCRD